MTILGSMDTDGFYTNAGVDIPVFNRGQTKYDLQPAGPSIMWTAVDANLDAIDDNDYDLIDWSRIVAVYVDEPYEVGILQGQSRCPAPTPDPNDNDLGQKIADRNASLSRVADAVRRKASHARFWVNFTGHEIDLILDESSNCDLNKPYIDVISMDIYGGPFNNGIRDRYNDLYTNHRHSPHQQLALVPGTFTTRSLTSFDVIPWLVEHVEYAKAMNQQCNLPLGPTRVTGIYDRCPVWMVAGWNGGRQAWTEGGVTYYPIDNPNSQALMQGWYNLFSTPKVDPSKAQAVRALLPLLNVQ